MLPAHPLNGFGELDFKTLWNQAIRPALSAGAETVVKEAAGQAVTIPEVQGQVIEASKTGVKATLARGVDWVFANPGKTALYAGVPLTALLGWVGYKVFIK